MSNDILSNRLMSAVGFVRGGVFADVGTDHGYLPIYLYKHKKIERAVAADINPMPLESARKNIAKQGVGEGVATCLSDGLEKLEPYAPEDIAIFGMGGELVCRIIGNAPWVKNNRIRLILQPMSKQDEVRKYLLDEGFSIVDEVLSLDDGKIYQTICAEYSGEKEEYTEAELILGKHNISRGGQLFTHFLRNKTDVYRLRLDGKKIAGLGHEERLLIEEFEKILESAK